MTSTIFLILSILTKITVADLVNSCAEITGFAHFHWADFALVDTGGGHDHCQIYDADFPQVPYSAPVTNPTKAPVPVAANYPATPAPDLVSWKIDINNDESFLAPDPTDVNYWPVTVSSFTGTATCADPAPISQSSYTITSPDTPTFYSKKLPSIASPPTPETPLAGSGHALVRYGRKISPTDCGWKADEVREEHIALDVCYFWAGAYYPRYGITSCTGSGPYTLTTTYWEDSGCSVTPAIPSFWFTDVITDGGPQFGCQGPFMSGSVDPAAPSSSHGSPFDPWFVDAKWDQIDILDCWVTVGQCMLGKDDPGANAIAKHQSKFSLAVVILLGVWHTVQFLI